MSLVRNRYLEIMINSIERFFYRIALIGLLSGTLFDLHAQWVKTSGPDSVRALASDVAILGDVLVQGILAGGIYGV